MPFTLGATRRAMPGPPSPDPLNDGGRVLLNGVLVGEVPTSTEATAIVNRAPS